MLIQHAACPWFNSESELNKAPSQLFYEPGLVDL